MLKRGDKLSESWRNTKKLGSLLGSSEDIMRRKQLSIAATRNLDHIWIRNTSIRKTTRIKLYKTLINPYFYIIVELGELRRAKKIVLIRFIDSN